MVTLDQAKELPEGLNAYKRGDGTRVVVAENAGEFPEAVRQDVISRAAASWVQNPEAPGFGGYHMLADDASRATGKHVVLIAPFHGYLADDPGDGPSYDIWLAINKPDGLGYQTVSGKAEVLAWVQAAFDASPDPSIYEVLVVE
ncbi:hypothetical protein [Actinotalea sp. K2]|uniref:hypothetical protein n=1 Tax=Actinotalea sp. K2 TaxID=2939438 RepID=UPI002016B7FD|nr:hypothetical protein [Actinotalea sp. K2]MCL3863277.1 hypothetical protein [Actinotalea sp. K2]